MREHKIVVFGGMGSGKSTMVRTIADGVVVDTDVANSDRAGADKATTTVALDYADIDLPNGDRLRLYGTPGQLRFEFLWPVLCKGASGLVVLVDAAGPTPLAVLDHFLEVLAEHGEGAPVVVGVTHLDVADPAVFGAIADAAILLGQHLPVVPVDARDKDQGFTLMDVLMSEIEANALVALHG